MSAVEVPVTTPPFTVELVGCQDCGITTNELTAPEGVATAGCKSGYGGD